MSCLLPQELRIAHSLNTTTRTSSNMKAITAAAILLALLQAGSCRLTCSITSTSVGFYATDWFYAQDWFKMCKPYERMCSLYDKNYRNKLAICDRYCGIKGEHVMIYRAELDACKVYYSRLHMLECLNARLPTTARMKTHTTSTIEVMRRCAFDGQVNLPEEKKVELSLTDCHRLNSECKNTDGQPKPSGRDVCQDCVEKCEEEAIYTTYLSAWFIQKSNECADVMKRRPSTAPTPL